MQRSGPVVAYRDWLDDGLLRAASCPHLIFFRHITNRVVIEKSYPKSDVFIFLKLFLSFLVD
jgi:hypothetical protein